MCEVQLLPRLKERNICFSFFCGGPQEDIT